MFPDVQVEVQIPRPVRVVVPAAAFKRKRHPESGENAAAGADFSNRGLCFPPRQLGLLPPGGNPDERASVSRWKRAITSGDPQRTGGLTPARHVEKLSARPKKVTRGFAGPPLFWM